MSKHVPGFGASGLLLVQALTVFSVAAPGAASAVTLAFYESFSDTSLSLTGLRNSDGEPVGAEAVRDEADYFGGENYQEILVRDASGNILDPAPPGIADVDIFSGRLFDAGYDVSVFSVVFDYGVDFSFENVSDEPLHAAFRLNRSVRAEAFSTVDTATSTASADNLGADLYFQDAAGDFFGAGDRLSPEAIEALGSDFSVVATSGGETGVSRAILHDFEVLLNPGDTFNADFFLMPSEGSLTNTPVAPVPLPAGAPLLLAALGGLAVARRWRDPAR